MPRTDTRANTRLTELPRLSDTEPSSGESLKEGAKVGAFIASIAILSLSIYAIAVPAAIATITGILAFNHILIASAAISVLTSPLGYGIQTNKSAMLRFIGRMLTITLAAVAMSSILSLTALPVIGSVAPLVAPIILTVISAFILITMSVKYGQHRFKIYKEDQQHQENQDRRGQEAKTGSSSSKNLDSTHTQERRSSSNLTTTSSAPELSQQTESSGSSLAARRSQTLTTRTSSAPELSQQTESSGKSLEGKESQPLITRTRSASASSQQGEASEDPLSKPTTRSSI